VAIALVVPLACGLLIASYAATTAASVTRATGSAAATVDCTGARRHVQTLTDPAAKSVKLVPRVTTVARLRRLAVPARLSRRVKGIETTTYRIDVRLIQMTLDENGDILLLVLDPKTHGKMFVAFPPAACTRAAGPAVRKAMSSARAALVAACGQPDPGSITRVGGRATVTGVGYVQPGERTPDAAPNGFELRPVLGFRATQCLLGG
jgi:hypothetical protein